MDKIWFIIKHNFDTNESHTLRYAFTAYDYASAKVDTLRAEKGVIYEICEMELIK